MFAWKLLAGLWRDWARKGSEVLSLFVFWPPWDCTEGELATNDVPEEEPAVDGEGGMWYDPEDERDEDEDPDDESEDE